MNILGGNTDSGGASYDQDLNKTDNVQFGLLSLEESGVDTAIKIIDPDATLTKDITRSIVFQTDTATNLEGMRIGVEPSGGVIPKSYIESDSSGFLLISNGTTAINVDTDVTIGGGDLILSNVDLLPVTTGGSDLGSASKQFNDLYLSGSIIGGDGLIPEIIGTDSYVSASPSVTEAGSYSTIIGLTSVSRGLTSGSVNNTMVGYNAGLLTTTTSANTYTGWNAGEFMTGGRNTAFGESALMGTASGSSGGDNVAIGKSALRSVITGTRNTGIGYYAGDTVTSGGYNTFLGALSDGTATGNYQCAIGYDAVVDINNTMVIGSSTPSISITTIRSGLDGLCDLGTSSKQFKDLYLSGSIIGAVTPLRWIFDDGTCASTEYFSVLSKAHGAAIDGSNSITISKTGTYTKLSWCLTTASSTTLEYFINRNPTAAGTVYVGAGASVYDSVNISLTLTAGDCISLSPTTTVSWGQGSIMLS